MAFVLFGYGGTFGEHRVFQAIAGKEVESRQVIVEGVELVYQPLEGAHSYVQGRLKESWGKGFYGAFGLRRNPSKRTLVTLYEVDEKVHTQVVSRLHKWNMQSFGWFRFHKMHGLVDGKKVEFMTEIIVDDRSLEEVPEGFRDDPGYIKFVAEMASRIKETYGGESPEGQASQLPERC